MRIVCAAGLSLWLFLGPAALHGADPSPNPTAAEVAKKRLDMVRRQPLQPDSAIFDGDKFPKIDFLNPELVHAAIGDYTIKTRYFDAQWNEVTAPKNPGRYGALVEFSAPDGTTFSDNFTLYKTPAPCPPRDGEIEGTAKFPSAYGLPDNISDQEAWTIRDIVDVGIRQFHHRCGEAMAVAALHDIATDPARWHGFALWTIDDAWWAELRKRLGENQDYPHLTYLPDGYDKDDKKWPLILFLHGSGERGADLTKIENQGPRGYIHKGHALPFIVVSPQCPLDEWWTPERLARFIDQMSSQYRVDPKRVYVTGLSMGGFGTIDLAAMYPEKIAAIAPVSGGENPALADRLKTMPTWFFHGAKDDHVFLRMSTDLADAMKKIGAPVKITIYPEYAHEKWDVTYSNPDLYTWLLAQSK